MLSTQPQRGSVDARHGFFQKEVSFFGPVAFNVGATPRDIQGNIILAQCLDHDCAYGNGIQTQILGASLTWKPAMMFGA